MKSYRTGDYVSLSDGLLYYHGRKDSQIQLNGIRVELGEIEANIVQEECVDEAVVLYINDILVAFVKIEENKKITKEELKTRLQKRIPRYMIPNQIIFKNHFSLNANNKINREYAKDI